MKKCLKGLLAVITVLLLILGFLAMSKEYAKSYVRQSVVEDILNNPDKEDLTYEVPSGDYLSITGEEGQDDSGFLESWSGIASVVCGENVKTEKLHLTGRIKIPALGIEEPIWEENSALAMRYGVILMKYSARLGEEGNSVIVGHRNTVTHTIFDKLTGIKNGDAAIVITTDGKEHKYKVNSTRYCSPYDLQSYVGSSEDYPEMITLVTCAREKGNSWRFIVTLIPE